MIAEMGLSHDGSLGAALAFVEAAAEAGADAVKFQTHIAEAEGTPEEKFRVPVFPQDATRQDYWRRTAFTLDQWKKLKSHADKYDLIFLSSPFSVEAVNLLRDVGVSAWKVASGETNNLPLLKEMLKDGVPILLSTGMSTEVEVDSSVAAVKESDVPLLLFQCTSRYPCPPERVGFNMLPEFSSRYGVCVGLSDHSGRTAAGVAAVVLGAASVEVHVAFSRDCFGPDVKASITFSELAAMVSDIRFVEAALSSSVAKDAEAKELSQVRSLFTKSVVAACDLKCGDVIQAADLCFKKPGTGIPVSAVDDVVGKVLSRDVLSGQLLAWSDIADAG